MKFQRPNFRHRMREHEPKRGAEFRSGEKPMDVEDDESEGTLRREAEYLRHLSEDQTPVVVHLRTGESFRGFIEYYDRRFIRLTREGAPNVFIFKNDIKYLVEG
jgi:sRNA-binding regulator protein Hfq